MQKAIGTRKDLVSRQSLLEVTIRRLQSLMDSKSAPWTFMILASSNYRQDARANMLQYGAKGIHQTNRRMVVLMSSTLFWR